MAQTDVAVDRPQRGIQGLASQANPAFAGAAVAIPVVALVAALAINDLRALVYVHVMAGILWTGIDLFMGMVVGPVLGGLEAERRAGFFRRFTPKMTFLMPTLAIVTIAAGIILATRLGKFPNSEPWLALLTAAISIPVVLLIAAQFNALTDRRTFLVLAVVVVASGAWLAVTLPAFAMTNWWIVAALAIVTLLSLVGFGIILPGEVKIYRQIVSPTPDVDMIAAIGMRNAKLSGVQGLLQLTIIYVMVNLRFL